MRLVHLSVVAAAALAALPACHKHSSGDTREPTHASVEHGRHANYLQAMSNLKSARTHLTRKPVGNDVVLKNDTQAAIAAVDRALVEVKKAAQGNGDDLKDTPPPVASDEPESATLHKALDDLKAAKRHVDQSEDNGEVKDERRRALHEIDEAIRLTENSIKAVSRGS